MDEHSASPRKRPRPLPPGEGPPLGPPSGGPQPFPSSAWLQALRSLRSYIPVQIHALTLVPDNVPPGSESTLLDEITQTHQVLVDALSSLEGGMEDLENALNATKPSEPPAPPLPLAPPGAPAAVASSYAQVTKRRTSCPAGTKPKPLTQPVSAKPWALVRVVALLQSLPDLEVRGLPIPALYRQLAELLSKVPGSPHLLGLQWNKKGNLVLAFPDGSTRTAIKSLYPLIRSALRAPPKLDFRFDVPWGKVHLASVWARDALENPVASEEDLLNTLRLNPVFKDMHLTTSPRWLKKPEAISGLRSSVIITFEDPDGSIECTLLKSRIYAFGDLVTLKKWHAVPAARGKGGVTPGA